MSEYGQVPEPGTIRFERLLPGTVERVWKYLIDSELRGKWLAEGEMELKKGKSFTLYFFHEGLSPVEEATPEKYKQFEGGCTLDCKITHVDPPNKLSYLWGGTTEVTFELTSQDDRVLLVLTHRNLGSEQMANVAAGWEAHLGILEDITADQQARPFWATHESAEATYTERMKEINAYFTWSGGVERSIRQYAEGKWSCVIERTMKSTIDRVWKAFTDPDDMSKWGITPSGDMRPGGTVTLDMGDPTLTHVKILKCDPPHHLRTTWEYGEYPSSEVELRLTEDGDSVRVRIEHFDSRNPDEARGGGIGWENGLFVIERALASEPPPGDAIWPAMTNAWADIEG